MRSTYRHTRLSGLFRLAAAACAGGAMTISAGFVHAAEVPTIRGDTAPPDHMSELLQGARQDDPEAMYTLAALGLAGRLGEQNPQDILRLLRQASDRGHHGASFILGTLYQRAWNMPGDLAAAFALFERAAHAGHIQSENALAALYYDGEGVAQDRARAAEWYQRASDQGSGIAQTNLGIMYLQGDGVAQDTARGIALLNQAADQEIAGAQFSLATAYAAGTTVAADPVQALDWYLLAAEQGDQHAQYDLGVRLMTGNGLIPMPEEGMKWLLIAASGPDRDRATIAREAVVNLTPVVGNKLVVDSGELARLWLMRRQWQTPSQ